MKKENIESIVKQNADKYRVEVRPKLWDKLEKRMDDHYSSITPKPERQFSWLRYAAAIVLLIGGGLLFTQIGTSSSAHIAEQFTLEELPSVSDKDQLYEDMIEFSQNYYRPLVSSNDKM